MTPTAAIVLGLLDQLGRASAYDLKGAAAARLGNFWSTPHSQVYRTAEQLAADGLVSSTIDTTPGGRSRTVYRLTARGRAALRAWRREPLDDLPDLRDTALLRLHLGATDEEIVVLASAQLAAHRAQLARYRAQLATDDGSGPRGPWLTLRAGILHEEVWLQYWAELGGDAPHDAPHG